MTRAFRITPQPGGHNRRPTIPKGRGPRVAASLVRPPREIRLLAQSAPSRFRHLAGMGYVVQDGSREPPGDSIAIPGPTLLLQRGEPVRITVVNRLAEPTAVHWHGIELESFPDGVPGWSGSPGRIMPPIAPGDSFVAEFVPPHGPLASPRLARWCRGCGRCVHDAATGSPCDATRRRPGGRADPLPPSRRRSPEAGER